MEQNKTMKKSKLNLSALAVFVSMFLLNSCEGNVRENLGLKKQAPDEFMVLSHPPLNVPSNFELPEPTSEAKKKASTVPQEAKKLILGGSKKTKSISTGEEALLGKANTKKSNPNIREILSKDHSNDKSEKDAGIISKVMNIKENKKDPIIDPDAELNRIKKNKAEGKSVTEGEVPVIKQEPESVIKRLMN